ncbi:hypothetical protein NDN11_10690 [Acinetobacter sp. C26M]|uniref:DUF6714 family protein n=1 Tax=unclassified Acinetobacter TaxID=196816 RepID=UPI0020371EBB|nr:MULTISPECIES: DUF6714 family protein [unclassified Acinetobacter]USA45196.1 hypothetical protein NDN11_10690 [Acinetobacter sp. C26M]USA48698.1 hypothetical protein NDN12_10690 [Acinetobacter sp. C26G]
MNKITLEYLKKTFPLYNMDGSYLLLECDFYDTHYRYFDQIDDDYLSAIEMSAEDLILEFGFDWPTFYVKAGLEAARSRSRPEEGIKTWEDVSYEYLYYFSDSCSFLDSNGFKFFLPAAIYHYLTTDENKAFLDSFVFRLQTRWDEDNHVFSDDQKQFIKEFSRANS